MSDAFVQHLRPHTVTSEHLEVLAKRASSSYLNGEVATMNDAVLGVVKTAGLNQEQLRRVIEIANTSTYLREFSKQGSVHKVIHFKGGPADPSFIIKECSAGVPLREFSRGSADYSQPPKEKKASVSSNVRVEREFWNKFASAGPEAAGDQYPDANPLGEVERLHDKLASEHSHITAQISGLEGVFEDANEALYQQIKQAALHEVPLSDVVFVLGTLGQNEHIKLAFSGIMPRLVREGVFTDLSLVHSLEKNAHIEPQDEVNDGHPMLEAFGAFCESLDKLAELRAAQREYGQGVAELREFMKMADNPGLLSKAWGYATRGADHLAPKVQAGVARLTGDGEFGTLASQAAGSAVKHLPHAALGAAGLEAYKHVAYNPKMQEAQRFVNRNIPGTGAWNEHVQGIQMGMGDPYYGGMQ
jgi:hypothetical protein